MSALVAIIGRPNVGKSTLFNRIIGERRAIESPVSGTTRDPVTAFYDGENVDFLLVDTGGLECGEKAGTIEANVQAQAHIAIAAADLILFCLDMKTELTANDLEAMRVLRRKAGNTPLIFVGTKAEGASLALSTADFYRLGVTKEPPLLTAALHNAGISDLLARIDAILLKKGFGKTTKRDDPAVCIAILGRPNVGKSSLVNALTNSEKLIVSPVSGTTRDAIDMEVRRDGKLFRLIDTAGIRRKSKVEEYIEQYSILRSLASLQRTDVAILILDAAEGVTHQDKHIVEYILEAKTGLILLVNKMDLLAKGEEARDAFLSHLKNELSFVPWAPVLFVSATERQNLQRIFPLAEEITSERKKRISTGTVNAFLQEVQQLQPLSGVRSARPRIRYGSQVGTEPPHFIFHGGRLDAIHFSSRRYLENRLRDAFGFIGTPLQIEMVTGKNPYTEKGRRLKSRKVKK